MSGGMQAGDFHRAKVDAIDAQLRSLGRGEGRLRLELGEALDALAQAHAHHALGFSSFEAYAQYRSVRQPMPFG